MANSTSSHSVTATPKTALSVPSGSVEVAVNQPIPERPLRLLSLFRHAFIWLLTLTIAASAIWGGLRLRRWTWELATPVHFTSDINRGYYWGHTASGPEGYLNLYEKMVHEVDAKQANEPGFDPANRRSKWNLFLDYAPLRLAVMMMWGRHVRGAGLPQPGTWRHDYAFHWPPLWFNAGMELIGAISAFALVRRWIVISDAGPPLRSWPREWLDRLLRRPAPVEPIAPPHRPFRGWWQGMTAALLLWFNPAAVTNAHAWPTWDMWVTAMYLLALLAASYGRWFWAGAVVGIGAMMKGQLFFGAPVFLAWTLLNGDWRNALRWAGGLAAGVALVATPWLTTYIPADELKRQYDLQASLPYSNQFPAWIVERLWNRPALIWTAGVALVAIVLPFIERSRRPRLRFGSELTAAVLLQWPIFVRFSVTAAIALIAASAAVLIAARFIRNWRDRLVLVFSATAVAMLGGIHFLEASNAWWRCGITYGTHHYPNMHLGAANLPALLDMRFGWRTPQETMFTIAGHEVTVQQATRGLFFAALGLCLWGVARQARRRDPRLLVAVIAPWLVFFALPTQIHDRYLIYAATIAAICIGQSGGMALLGVVLTLITWVLSLRSMLLAPGTNLGLGRQLQSVAPDWFGPSSGYTLWRNVSVVYPDIAWAVLLAMLVIVYTAVTSTKRAIGLR